MANEKLIVKTDVQVEAERILTGELKQQLVRSLQSLNLPVQEVAAQMNIMPEPVLTKRARNRFQKLSKERLQEIDKVLGESTQDDFKRSTSTDTPAARLRALDSGSLAALRQFYALLDRMSNQISEGERYTTKKFQTALQKAQSGKILTSREANDVESYIQFLQGQRKVVEAIGNLISSAKPGFVSVQKEGQKKPVRVEAAQLQLGTLKSADLDKLISNLNAAVTASYKAAEAGGRAGKSAQEVLAEQARKRNQEAKETRASAQARRDAIVITDDDRRVLANVKAAKAKGFNGYSLGSLGTDAKVIAKFQLVAALERQLALGVRGGSTPASLKYGKEADEFAALLQDLNNLPRQAKEAALQIARAADEIDAMEKRLQYKAGQAMYSRKGRVAARELLTDNLDGLDRGGLEGRLASANAADAYLTEQLRRIRQRRLSGLTTEQGSAALDRLEGRTQADRAEVRTVRREIEERLTGVAALRQLNEAQKKFTADLREQEKQSRARRTQETREAAQKRRDDLEAARVRAADNARTIGLQARSALEAQGIGSLDRDQALTLLDSLKTGKAQFKADRTAAGVAYGLGSAEFQASDRNYKQSAKDIDEVNQRLRTLAREASAAERGASKLTGAFGQMNDVMQLFVRYALFYGSFYAILAGIRALITGVVDLEKQLKSIQAVAGATRDEMKGVNASIKEVAATTKFSLSEVANATQTLVQAGVMTKDIDAVLRSTANFAQATETSLTVAADVITSLRDVYKELSDAKLADQLTKTINLSKLTGEGLKTIVSLGAQVGSSYGLKSEQFLAAGAVLRNAGLKESTVGTGLRQAILEIFSPDKKTTDALIKRYAALGEELTGPEIQRKFQGFTKEASPLVAVLKELRRVGFGGEGDSAFARIFDIRAENAIKALVANLEELEATESRIAMGSPAMSASRTQMEALANQLDNLRGAMTVLADALLGDFIPGLTSGIRTLADEINNLTEKNEKLKSLTGFGFSTAALAGVGTGLIAATAAKGSVYKKVAAFGAGTAIGTTGATIGLGLGADTDSGAGATISGALGLLGSVMSVIGIFGGRGGAAVDGKTVEAGGKTLRSIFTSGIWKSLATFVKEPGAILRSLSFLFRLLGGLPGLAITGAVAVGSLLLAGDRKQEALGASTDGLARIGSDRQKQAEQAANYVRNSAGGVAAGTTVEAEQAFAQLQADTESAMRQLFGPLASNSELRTAIERMGKYGQEKGSRAQEQIVSDIDKLLSVYGTGLAELGISNEVLSDLSATFLERQAKIKGIREDMAQSLKIAKEQEKELLDDEKNGKFSPELARLRAARKLQIDGVSAYQLLTSSADVSGDQLVRIFQGLEQATRIENAKMQADRLQKAETNFKAYRKAFSELVSSTEFVSEQLSGSVQQQINNLVESGLSVPEAMNSLVSDVDKKLQMIRQGIEATRDTEFSWITAKREAEASRLEQAKAEIERQVKRRTEAAEKFYVNKSAELRGQAAQAGGALMQLTPAQLAKLPESDRKFVSGISNEFLIDPSRGFVSDNIKGSSLANINKYSQQVDESGKFQQLLRLAPVGLQGLQEQEQQAAELAAERLEVASERSLQELSKRLEKLQDQRRLLAAQIEESKQTVEGTKEILKDGGYAVQLEDLDRSIVDAQYNLKAAEAKAAYAAATRDRESPRAKFTLEKALYTADRERNLAAGQIATDADNLRTDVLTTQATLIDGIKSNYQEILKLTAERNKEEAEATFNLDQYMEAFKVLQGVEVDSKRRELTTFVAQNKWREDYLGGTEKYESDKRKLEEAVKDAELRLNAAAAMERALKSSEFAEKLIEKAGRLREGEAEGEFYGRPVRLANQKDRLETTLEVREADRNVQLQEYARLRNLANQGDTQSEAALEAQAEAVDKSSAAYEKARAEMEDYRRTNEQIDGSVRAIYSSLTETDWTAAIGGLKASAVETEALIRDGLLSVVDQMGDAFADNMLNMGNSTESFSKRFKRLMRDALEDLSRFLIKQAFLGMVQKGMGFVGGLFKMGGGTGTASGSVSAVNVSGLYGADLMGTGGLRDGGMLEGFADGGIIGGPGTGRSDSIYGYVVDAQGRKKRGIKVSNQEAILNAKAVRELGKAGVDALNTQGISALQQQATTVVNQLPAVNNQSLSMAVPVSIEAASGGGGEGGISKEDAQMLGRLIEVRMVELLKTQMRPGGLLNKGRR